MKDVIVDDSPVLPSVTSKCRPLGVVLGNHYRPPIKYNLVVVSSCSIV